MFSRIPLGLGCMAVSILSTPAFALTSPAIPMAIVEEKSSAALSLAAAVNLALAQHPDLQASQFNQEAAQASIEQARLRPNPELVVESENVGQTTQTISAQWVQRLELGGKREQRITLAEREHERSVLTRDLRKAEIVAQVRSNYIQTVLAYQQLSNQQANQKLMQEWANSIQKRVEAGKASPLEADRAELSSKAAQDMVQRAKHEWELAISQLMLAIGQKQPFTISGKSITNSQIPAWEQVEPLLGNSLRMKLLMKEIEQQEAEVALQKGLSTQDIQISAGLKHARESGDKGVMLGVSVPLPLLNRNQGGIRQAQLRVQEARARYQAKKQAFETQVRNVWADLRSLQTTVRLYDEQLLPGAEQSFQKAREGYQVGKFSFMDMLDAQRSLLTIRADRYEYLKRYAELEGQLYALIGDVLPLNSSMTQGSTP